MTKTDVWKVIAEGWRAVTFAGAGNPRRVAISNRQQSALTTSSPCFRDFKHS